MTSHKKNVFAMFAGLLAGLTLLLFGCWQLDLQVAPRIDWSGLTTIPREILRTDIFGHIVYWYMSDANAYVMFFMWIILGPAIMVFTVFLALWYWDD